MFSKNLITCFGAILLASISHYSEAATPFWGFMGATTFTSDLTLNTNWGSPSTAPGSTDSGIFVGPGNPSPTLNVSTTVNAYILNSGPYNFTIGTNGFLTYVTAGGLIASGSANSSFTLTDNGRIEVAQGSTLASGNPVLYTLNDTSLIIVQQNSTTGLANFIFGSTGSELNLIQNTNNSINGSITGTAGSGTLTSGIFISGSVAGVVFTFNGTNKTYSGQTGVNHGTLQAGNAGAFSANSDIVLTNDGILDLNNFANTIGSLTGTSTNQVTLGSGTLTLNGNPSTTYAGGITGTGGLTKEGTGIFTLSGSTNYTGQTDVNNGTLQAGNNGAFAQNSDVVMTNAAILDLNSFDNVINSLSGTSTNQVTLGSGTLTLQGNPSTTYAGSITGTGDIVKKGTGTFTLSGSGLNTYSGITRIDNGTIQSGAVNSFSPNSQVNLAVSGTTLDLNNNNNVIGSLNGVAGSHVTLGSGTLTTGGDNTITTFTGGITGTGGVTKDGTGALNLNGLSGANTYTGTTTINAGTLRAGATNTLSPNSAVVMTGSSALDIVNDNVIASLTGTATNHVFVVSATLTTGGDNTNTTYAGAITGNRGLTKNGTGIFTLSGTGLNTYNGTTTINQGTLRSGALNSFSATSAVVMTNSSILDLNGNNNTIASLTGTSGNLVTLGAGTLTTTNNASTTYAGAMTGTGGLTKIGSGTFTLSGGSLNVYSGPTTINAGTLRSGAINSFSPNSAVVLIGTSTLDLNNFNNTIASLTGTSGNVVHLGTATLTTGGDNTNTTYAGIITAGTGGITKNGTGIFTLSGSGLSTYSGQTTINAGTLQSGALNSFSPNSAVVMAGTSVLDLNSNNNVIGSLAGTAGNTVTLGSGILTTGGDNTSTTFAGAITGTGGLTKNGTGIFTLSGTGLNTYSGQTTINTGTLQSGALNSFSPNSAFVMTGSSILDLNSNNNTIASLTGTSLNLVTLGSGTLTTGNAANTTFSGAITGTGGLTKNGTGIFTLSGPGLNTYSGVTTINAGTLQSGALNSFSPNSAVVMTGSSILDLNSNNNAIGSLTGTSLNLVTLGSATLTTGGNNTSTTYAGAITGTGGLTKVGTGIFTLSGSGLNTYSGNTSVNAGTLAAGNNNSFSPSSNVSILSGGTLDAATFTNTIGALTGLTGSTVNVTAPGTLTFGNSQSTTFAGAFTGSGNLHTQGSGSFTYTGNSPVFTGTTTIGNPLFSLIGFLGGNAIVNNDTTLSLNGTLGGNGIVNSGGTLNGNGTIGGNLTINSGGKISPGNNNIGVLSVNGNYTQNANSTYVVEINNTFQSDRINIAGSAALNGGNIEIIPLGGYNLFNNYLILNANGGVSGAFQGVTNPFSKLINPVLHYTATQVFLELQTAIINGACTDNTKIIAAILDNAGNLSPEILLLLNRLVVLNPDDVCNVLEEMTGQQYSLSFVTAESNAREFLRRLFDPLRSIITAVPSCDICCRDLYEPTFTYTPWLEIGGGETIIQGNHNVKGINLNNFDVSGGFQGTLNEATLGVAGSYVYGRTDYRLNGSEKSQTAYAAIYALYKSSFNMPSFCIPSNVSSYKWYVLGNLVSGYSNNNLKRHVDVGDQRYLINGSYHINQIFGYVEGGFDLYSTWVLVQPFLGFESGILKRNRINEKGGSPLNLSINEKTTSNTYSRLGFHITTDSRQFTYLNESYKNLINCLPKISLSLDLAWACRLTKSSGYGLTENFQAFGPKFKLKGYKSPRHSLDYAVTALADLDDAWKFFVEAEGSFFGQSVSYNFLGGLTYSW